MFETEIRVHLLQATILLCQLFELSNVRNLHAAILCFPVVVSRIRYPALTAEFLYLAAAFNLFQYPNYFGFFETCFANLPFSFSASLCRKTPKMRGAILREAYTTNKATGVRLLGSQTPAP